jgi:hypothetical protein
MEEGKCYQRTRQKQIAVDGGNNGGKPNIHVVFGWLVFSSGVRFIYLFFSLLLL